MFLLPPISPCISESLYMLFSSNLCINIPHFLPLSSLCPFWLLLTSSTPVSLSHYSHFLYLVLSEHCLPCAVSPSLLFGSLFLRLVSHSFPLPLYLFLLPPFTPSECWSWNLYMFWCISICREVEDLAESMRLSERKLSVCRKMLMEVILFIMLHCNRDDVTIHYYLITPDIIFISDPPWFCFYLHIQYHFHRCVASIYFSGFFYVVGIGGDKFAA